MSTTNNKTNKVVNSILIVLFAFALTSCKEPATKQTQIQQLKVIEVRQTNIPIYKEFVGQVYGEKDIPIRARIEGFLEGIHFNEGFKVTKGQLLYSIDPAPFEAKVNTQRSRVAEAETMLAKAKSDLNRYKPLAEVKAVSESDLDAAQAQYDAALSSVDAAKSNLKSAQIELGYTKIYSPINGTIGKTEAKVGDFVGREPNPVILNIVSKINNVRVEFFITEAEYLLLSREVIAGDQGAKRVRRSKEQEENLKLILSDNSTYKHKGKVEFIDRGVDATTGSMLVQSAFPNPDRLLRPGLFGKVIVNMGVIENGILVPQRCVTELQGKYSVYVVSDENIVETRQIVVGEKINDYWIVKSGLKAKENIILEGLQLVSSGIEIKPIYTEFQSQANQQ